MKAKICFVVAVPGTANAFLRDHIEALQDNYDVYIAGNIKSRDEIAKLNVSDFHNIDIYREISLFKDIRAVWQLFRYFKKMKFDAVHSVSPKAGLTCALAARVAGIRHRTHIFTGQVWATRTGAMRSLLKSIDWIIAHLDNHILVDGESQRQFLIQNGVVRESKSHVLGAGSISGVNTERFAPSIESRAKAREEIGVNEDKVVFTFMGRANKEKGVYEIFEAFNNLVPKHPEAFLLFFGSDEGNCFSHLTEYPNIRDGVNFMYFGRTSTPGFHLQASDVFLMPSYREGFGTSVIEASCLGIPVICSDAYGIMDAMVDNVTGWRCNVADVASLQDAMEKAILSPDLRKQYGQNGRKRVLELFSGHVITQEWVKFYQHILN